MKLTPEVSIESVRAGQVRRGGRGRASNVFLDDHRRLAGHDRFASCVRPARGAARTCCGRSCKGRTRTARSFCRPMLMLESGSKSGVTGMVRQDDLRPVRTIPRPLSPPSSRRPTKMWPRSSAPRTPLSRAAKIKRRSFFTSASRLDMDTPVCLNPGPDSSSDRRGFSASQGPGKTFLTRICLCGILRARRAVNLIFDMHFRIRVAGNVRGRRGNRAWTEAVFSVARADVHAGCRICPSARHSPGLRGQNSVLADRAGKTFCCSRANSI